MAPVYKELGNSALDGLGKFVFVCKGGAGFAAGVGVAGFGCPIGVFLDYFLMTF